MDDVLGYEGKHAVVTGAASGMGEQVARICHELGANVTALDLKPVSTPVKTSITMIPSTLQLSGVVISATPIGSDPRSVTRAATEMSGQALNRNLAHLAYHVGQIVLLAKHWVGASWQTLTIARGQSKAFTPALRTR